MKHNLIGKRFGRLVVQGEARRNDRLHWQCLCDCGGSAVVATGPLVGSRTRSCGCLAREAMHRAKKHGYSRTGQKTAEYRTWEKIVGRVQNPNVQHFDRYGGRGLTICARWRNSFEQFLADMGGKPSPAHSIDRKDNDKGYWCGKAECPECGPLNREPNCRWATQKEQMRNQSRNHLITHDERTQPLAAWAEETGIAASTIRKRLRLGWSAKRALTTPVAASAAESFATANRLSLEAWEAAA